MLSELGAVSATAHGFVWVCGWWVSGRDAFGRRCRSSCAQRRYSNLLMPPETRQCFVASLSERVGVVILHMNQSMQAAVAQQSRCCTVGMLEMVFRLHTHDLWNAKTSGVGRNVSIIVDGPEGRPVGQLLHMVSWLSWEAGKPTGGWQGSFRHS